MVGRSHGGRTKRAGRYFAGVVSNQRHLAAVGESVTIAVQAPGGDARKEASASVQIRIAPAVTRTMAQWFIQRSDDGHEEGPLRPSELLQRVRQGEVTRTTKIRKDNSTWFDASAVGGLFEAALRPTIEYFCPVCQAEVNEPPVTCSKCGREIYKAITRITENNIATPSTSKSKAVDTAKRSVTSWLKRKGLGDGKDPPARD